MAITENRIRGKGMKTVDFRETLYMLKMNSVNMMLPKAVEVRCWQKEYEKVKYKITFYKATNTTIVNDEGTRQRLGYLGFFLIEVPSLKYKNARIISEKSYGYGTGIRTWKGVLEGEGEEFYKNAIHMAERDIMLMKAGKNPFIKNSALKSKITVKNNVKKSTKRL